MALNAAQIAARMGKLGGSDMKPLMDGDALAIDKLWREKTGQSIPDDLEDVWPVQLGVATEPLNVRWFERKQRMHISRIGDVVSHVRYDWAVCTLDGWVDDLQCPLEVQARRWTRADRGHHRPLSAADAVAVRGDRRRSMRAVGHHGRPPSRSWSSSNAMPTTPP